MENTGALKLVGPLCQFLMLQMRRQAPQATLLVCTFPCWWQLGGVGGVRGVASGGAAAISGSFPIPGEVSLGSASYPVMTLLNKPYKTCVGTTSL